MGSVINNVFGFKTTKAFQLEDMYFPLAFLKTFQNSEISGIIKIEKLNKFGRSLLNATVKPKLALTYYSKLVFEGLYDVLDFFKYNKNISSLRFR